MAYDIGPRIGIDGEAEFRKQLQQVNTSIKTLGSEMKAVTSSFIGQEDSIEALSAQNEVLTKSIDAQNDKLKQQQNFLERAKEKFGDNAEETQKWQRAVNESTAELNKLQAQLRDNERAMENFGKETEEVEGSLEEAADAGVSFGDVLKANVAGDLIVNGMQAIADVAMELASELWNLDEATKDYRAEQGKLITAFEANGHSARTAEKAYGALYKVIGDSGEATEAAQLLANLANNTADVNKWAKIAAGTAGQFGDALPITSLIEAANEAAKTGESVSALDDALNWIGIDAEDFGEQLAATKTQEERLKLITDTLSDAYDDAASSFKTTNAELIKTRENELALLDAQGEVGESVSVLKNQLIEDFAPALGDVADAFSDMLEGVEGADAEFEEAIQGFIGTANETLPQFAAAGTQMLFSVLSGLLSDPQALSDTIFAIIESISEILIENAPELAVSGVLLIGELLVGLIAGVDDIIIAVPEMIGRIVSAFWEHRGEFVNLGKRFLEAIKEGLGDFGDWITGGGTVQGWYTGPVPQLKASGLDYVPYDGYLASLHQGEMILTARQADMMRGQGITKDGMQNLAAAMVNGMQVMSGADMDSPVVINLLMPDGDAFASWQLPSLIRVANAAGTPIVSTV